MKKKKGRGRDYKKALLTNLVKSLVSLGKITTTKAKAKKLKPKLLKRHGGVVRMVNVKKRRGDNAPQVLLEWQKEGNAKDKNNQKRRDKKKLASY